MPPQSSAQRSLVAQFVLATGASEKTAQRYLKNASYKLEVAADAYFNTNGSSANANASAAQEAALDKMFDEIRNQDSDDKDAVGVESLMAYLSSLGVNAESGEIFVVLEIVQAQNLSFTRKSYVDGWRATGVPASAAAHAQHVRATIDRLATDADLFRRVYRHAFVAGKEEAQKALGLDVAIVYWDMLLQEPGKPWRSRSRGDWLELWKRFLGEKWTRSVNRDMWNMTLEFANKTVEADGLGFWSEDGAWPGVVDDFVEWCRATGAVPAEATNAAGARGAGMEIDD